MIHYRLHFPIHAQLPLGQKKFVDGMMCLVYCAHFEAAGPIQQSQCPDQFRRPLTADIAEEQLISMLERSSK